MTCDAHLQTRLSYSSQKSRVKIWFGLVKIVGMLIFRGGGAEAPILGGVTCDLSMQIFEPGRGIPVKVMCENLVQIG